MALAAVLTPFGFYDSWIFANFACANNQNCNMKTLLSIISVCIFSVVVYAADTVTISGKVTDYKGNPVDSCTVLIYNPDFSEAFETVSDAQGCYALDSIPKGRYAAIAAMRVNEYPRLLQVAPEDMKLEFWAWNVIADRDITLNIRYDKLELYGTTAFLEYGGRREMLIYTRPMSVTKVIAYQNFVDKADAEKNSIVTVEPQYMSFEVYADGKPLEIYSVQPLTMQDKGNSAGNDTCYLLQVELPQDIYNRSTPYEIRVVGHNSQYDEHGESVYYLEPPQYDWKK